MPDKSASARPTISVTIATYNRSQMVREAVVAAWNQTLRPHEIVVSDDSSTDHTLDVLRKLQEEIPILKIIENSKNSGGVPNWNKVIDRSSGEIIAWCSDDDRFKADHLGTAVGYLLKHEDVDLVHAGFDEVLDGGTEGEIYRITALKSHQPILLTRQNVVDYFARNFSWPFHPSTMVFRRKLWEKVGPFDPRFALADTDWFLRAAIDHRLVYLPYYGVINRRHFGASGNWSNRVGSIEMQRELYEAIHGFVRMVRVSAARVRDLDHQLSRWTRRYRTLLLRIFIARSRAGNFAVARACASEISKASPILSYIPSSLRTPAVYGCYLLLNFIQLLLPGGRSKYREIGKFTPM